MIARAAQQSDEVLRIAAVNDFVWWAEVFELSVALCKQSAGGKRATTVADAFAQAGAVSMKQEARLCPFAVGLVEGGGVLSGSRCSYVRTMPFQRTFLRRCRADRLTRLHDSMNLSTPMTASPVYQRQWRIATFRRWLQSIALCLGLTSSLAGAVICSNNLPPSNPDIIYTPQSLSGVPVVTDTRTGLMWKRDAEAGKFTWKAALARAEAATDAGFYDWRLPNLKELRSLIEECQFNPSINTTLFPGPTIALTWSSSPTAAFSNGAWSVGFTDGAVFGANPINEFSVRLVRDGEPFLLLANVLPASNSTEMRVMRGGQGHRWFQLLSGGSPLPGAVVQYRYALANEVATATPRSVTADGSGLIVVSTPPLNSASLGFPVLMGQSLNFVLVIDQVSVGSNVVTSPFAPQPFTYTVAARAFEQEWNVGIKAGLDVSIEAQLGAGARIQGLGARARAGYKLSAGGELGHTFGWARQVSDYGDFWDKAKRHSLSADPWSINQSFDAELTARIKADAEVGAGFGVGSPQLYAGIGAGVELSVSSTESALYAYPTLLAPQGTGACLMGFATLLSAPTQPGFIRNSLSSSVCGQPLASALRVQTKKLAVSASLNAGGLVSTRSLTRSSADPGVNFGQHLAFAGVQGEVGGVTESSRNLQTGTGTITKTLFAKGSSGLQLVSLSEMRSKATPFATILKPLEVGLNASKPGEYRSSTMYLDAFNYDAFGFPVAVEFAVTSGKVVTSEPSFEAVSLANETTVEESTVVHSRSEVDAIALDGRWNVGDIEFSRSPVVSRVEQALTPGPVLGGGFSVPPGYYIERSGTTPTADFALEFEGALGVGLGVAVALSAETITNSLTERGQVAQFTGPNAQPRYAPFALETYQADAEITDQLIAATAIRDKMRDALSTWVSDQVFAVGEAIGTGAQIIRNGVSSVTTPLGTALTNGWRIVFTRERPSSQANNAAFGALKLPAMAGVSASAKVVGQVHFLNLLSPTNEDIDAFPEPFQLKIGGVTAALVEAGLTSADAAAVRLVRVDRASQRPVLVMGVYNAVDDVFSASVQRRGAYFLVVDRDAPVLTSFLISTAQQSPKLVKLLGRFDPLDSTGIDVATFSVTVDGVERAVVVGPQANLNSMTGEFVLLVGNGTLLTGGPTRVQIALRDGAGNLFSVGYCAHAAGGAFTLEASNASTCAALAVGSLNITGAASGDRTVDAVLLMRYLLGFRGSALIQGLTLSGSRTLASDIEAYIGNAALFDVLARQNSGAPRAQIDGLILLRLVQGVTDSGLLGGIELPPEAQLTVAADIRAYVNRRMGTSF